MLSRRDFPGERVRYQKRHYFDGTKRNGWTGTVVRISQVGFDVHWDQGDTTTYTWRAVADKKLNPKMEQSDAYIHLIEDSDPTECTWWIISARDMSVVTSAANKEEAESIAEDCARLSKTQEAFYVTKIHSRFQQQPVVQVATTKY